MGGTYWDLTYLSKSYLRVASPLTCEKHWRFIAGEHQSSIKGFGLLGCLPLLTGLFKTPTILLCFLLWPWMGTGLLFIVPAMYMQWPNSLPITEFFKRLSKISRLSPVPDIHSSNHRPSTRQWCQIHNWVCWWKKPLTYGCLFATISFLVGFL